MVRRESSVEFGARSGVKVTFTRKGVEVGGWYDSGFGGIEGGSLTWEQIDAVRADLAKVQHRKDSE